jgi:hypothetical protein
VTAPLPHPARRPGREATARQAARIAAAAAALGAAGVPVPAAVQQAAGRLCQRGAVALPRAHDRALALSLAAVAWAAEARPVHLIAPDDEAAAALAARTAPWWRACGLPADAVEVTTLRRLAAARTQAERALRQPGGEAVAPPPSHAALVDELDRVLVDEAGSSITLAVADDSTGLVDALAAAAALAQRLRPAGAAEPAVPALAGQAGTGTEAPAAGAPDTDELTAAERTALDAEAPRWPPVWRARERREQLLRQAFHVRRLRRGRDYELTPQGQVLFDDGLMARLPDRGYATGLTQALQLHLGLPAAPVARTVGRLHADLLLAPYARLGGAAPSLHGLRRELWRRHQLRVSDGTAALPLLPLLWCGSAAAAEAAITAWLAEASAHDGPARLLVLRRAQALVRWAPVVAALRERGLAVSLAVDAPHSPLPPALGLHELPAGRPLALLFAEPLDSVRAERAWQHRAAEHAGQPVSATQLLVPPLPLVRDQLPVLAAALPALDPALAAEGALRRRLHTAALRLARAVAAWRGGRQRRQQGEREQRLAQQLSFTTGQRSAAPVAPWRPPAVPAADGSSTAP